MQLQLSRASCVQIDTKLFGRSLSSLRIENYAPVQQFVLTIALGLLGLSLTVGGASPAVASVTRRLLAVEACLIRLPALCSCTAFHVTWLGICPGCTNLSACRAQPFMHAVVHACL